MLGHAYSVYTMRGNLHFKLKVKCVILIIFYRYYHENTGGSKNNIWWSTNDELYKYFEGKLQ
jgi:hypothetical protein